MNPEPAPIRVYIDADACPVKEEALRVARRHGFPMVLVANSSMRVPPGPGVELVVVRGHLDAADDWIAERVDARSLVVTADIPLAARCLARGARVLDPRGKPFSEDSIGDALATRELMSQLRDMGTLLGGPAPFSPKDRSRFLQTMEDIIQRMLRGR